jgi:energy-converting hydrogenase Eha subunit C
VDEHHSEPAAPAAPVQPLGGQVKAMPAAASRSRGLPDLGPVALAAGLVGLLTGPLLIGDPTARYVVLVADLIALALGAYGLWTALRRAARLDLAIAAILCGGVSLFLYLSFVTNPPQGGT